MIQTPNPRLPALSGVSDPHHNIHFNKNVTLQRDFNALAIVDTSSCNNNNVCSTFVFPPSGLCENSHCWRIQPPSRWDPQTCPIFSYTSHTPPHPPVNHPPCLLSPYTPLKSPQLWRLQHAGSFFVWPLACRDNLYELLYTWWKAQGNATLWYFVFAGQGVVNLRWYR